jgi:hypothetical protein
MNTTLKPCTFESRTVWWSLDLGILPNFSKVERSTTRMGASLCTEPHIVFLSTAITCKEILSQVSDPVCAEERVKQTLFVIDTIVAQRKETSYQPQLQCQTHLTSVEAQTNQAGLMLQCLLGGP